MKIGLVDVDGHNFPNLALMKISAWHKQNGDDVEMLFPMMRYDKVYKSKIFDFTLDYETCIQADEILVGGRAYDKKKTLSEEIEKIYPDYSLYNIKNTAYGYLTRGCPRACGFCDVVNIEGRISHKVANLDQFWNGQKEIKLLDPNLLACKNKNELLDQLIESRAWIDITQGLDARLLTGEITEKLIQLKIKMIHFAWDGYGDDVPYMLWHFKKHSNLDFRKLRVYVLVNYNTEWDYDIYRVMKLKELGYDPYIMIYDRDKLKRGNKLRKFQRWVNNKFIFRTCETFEEYQKTI